MSDKSKKSSVVVIAPQAAVSMVLHAKRHGTTVVHGVLIGSRSSGETIRVTNAIPLCHEPPTRTLVDTSLAMVQAQHGSDKIVGWFTAPEVLDDESPGPAALRIVASLETTDFEPVLVVLSNTALVKFLADMNEGSASELFKAYGKDFGKQYMEPLPLSLEKGGGVAESVREACQKGIVVVDDLVDHWEDSFSPEWDPSTTVSNLVAEHC